MSVPEHAVIDHVGACSRAPWMNGGGDARRRHAHVARDANPFGAEIADEAAANQPGDFLVDLAGVEAADVIGLEDVGVDTRPVGSVASHSSLRFRVISESGLVAEHRA
jgi:hypothetical protein